MNEFLKQIPRAPMADADGGATGKGERSTESVDVRKIGTVFDELKELAQNPFTDFNQVADAYNRFLDALRNNSSYLNQNGSVILDTVHLIISGWLETVEGQLEIADIDAARNTFGLINVANNGTLHFRRLMSGIEDKKEFAESMPARVSKIRTALSKTNDTGELDPDKGIIENEPFDFEAWKKNAEQHPAVATALVDTVAEAKLLTDANDFDKIVTARKKLETLIETYRENVHDLAYGVLQKFGTNIIPARNFLDTTYLTPTQDEIVRLAKLEDQVKTAAENAERKRLEEKHTSIVDRCNKIIKLSAEGIASADSETIAKLIQQIQAFLSNPGGDEQEKVVAYYRVDIEKKVEELRRFLEEGKKIAGTRESVNSLVGDILNSLHRLDTQTYPLASNRDQIGDNYGPLYEKLETIDDLAEKTKVEKKILTSNMNSLVRSIKKEIEDIESNSRSWEYFKPRSGNSLIEIAQGDIKSLSNRAERSKHDDVVAEISNVTSILDVLMVKVKAIHGFWLNAGVSILGQKGTDKGFLRDFPSAPNTDEFFLESTAINKMIRDDVGFDGININREINPTERKNRLTTTDIRNFELNPDFESLTGDFLEIKPNGKVELQNGKEVIVKSETTMGWLMRQFDTIYGAKDRFKDPKTGNYIDALEFHEGDKLPAMLDYVLRKAKAWELPVDEQMVLRAFRFHLVLTVNNVALSAQPTRITDNIFKAFWWSKYLKKELTGETLGAEPFMFYALLGQPEVNILETYGEMAGNKKMMREVYYSLIDKGLISGGGFSSWIGGGASASLKEELVTVDGEEVKRTKIEGATGPGEYLFSFPLIDRGDSKWDILPPLAYFRDKNLSQIAGENLPLEQVKDKNGNYVYEGMDFDGASLYNYYTDYINKAKGFVQNFFHSSRSKFIQNVDGEISGLMKNIQYATPFLPGISFETRFNGLNQNEYEDKARLLVLITYILLKFKERDEKKSGWKAHDAKQWAFDFLKEKPNYIGKSKFFGNDKEEIYETVISIIEVFADSYSTFAKGALLVAEKAISRTEFATKRT